MRVRRASSLMANDPYTVIIALDDKVMKKCEYQLTMESFIFSPSYESFIKPSLYMLDLIDTGSNLGKTVLISTLVMSTLFGNFITLDSVSLHSLYSAKVKPWSLKFLTLFAFFLGIILEGHMMIAASLTAT